MAPSPTKTRRIGVTGEARDLEQAAAAFSGETLSERTRYVLNDEAAQRFLSALEQPSPDPERGLRRLVEKPSVLPEA